MTKTKLRFKAWKGKWAEKEKAFEYICLQLANWYMEQNKIKTIEEFNTKNDLSILKTMKLLFFTVSGSDELMKLFDNWHAKAYGHMENDVQIILYQTKRERRDNATYHILLEGKILLGPHRMILT